MSKRIVFSIIFLLLTTVFLNSCNNNKSDSTSSEIEIDENLISAATETSSNFNGTDVQRVIYQFNEIPNELWASEIEAMEPIRVYSHNNNIVIVLVDTNDREEGIYVYVPFSSYLPESDENVEYTVIDDDIYEFIRRK